MPLAPYRDHGGPAVRVRSTFAVVSAVAGVIEIVGEAITPTGDTLHDPGVAGGSPQPGDCILHRSTGRGERQRLRDLAALDEAPGPGGERLEHGHRGRAGDDQDAVDQQRVPT